MRLPLLTLALALPGISGCTEEPVGAPKRGSNGRLGAVGGQAGSGGTGGGLAGDGAGLAGDGGAAGTAELEPSVEELCPAPGYPSPEEATMIGRVSAQILDQDDVPFLGSVSVCGTDLCYIGTPYADGSVTIFAGGAIRSPAFKYGLGYDYAALGLALDAGDHDLGVVRAIRLPAEGDELAAWSSRTAGDRRAREGAYILPLIQRSVCNAPSGVPVVLQRRPKLRLIHSGPGNTDGERVAAAVLGRAVWIGGSGSMRPAPLVSGARPRPRPSQLLRVLKLTNRVLANRRSKTPVISSIETCLRARQVGFTLTDMVSTKTRRRTRKSAAVAVYLRVSSDSQNTDSQHADIRRWLKRSGYAQDTVRWFEDIETGKNLDRPAFGQLQDAILRGEVGTVVVWKLDRISRKLTDGIKVLADWCEQGARVVSVTQRIDLNGAVGRLVASVLFGVAEIELEHRAERQAAGIAAAKERGVYKGRKPGTTVGKPARAEQLRDRGLTAPEIATAMGVSERTVFRYLSV